MQLQFLLRTLFFSITLILTALPPLLAQDELNPDRPDQTEEVHLVPRGRLQLEAGLMSNRFDTGRNALVVRMMLRYGIMKGVEVGLLAEEGRERNRYIDETVQSTYPLALRLKMALLGKHDWLPEMSLISYVQLPGAKNDKGEHARTSVAALLAFLHELSDKWKLEYNAGFQQDAYSSEMGWLVNTSLHYKVSEKLEAFGGSYSQFKGEEKPFHNIDIGIGYLLKENLQVDIAAGTSVNRDAGNQFLTVGFSYRL
jgi:hypothetical protein